MRHSKVRIAKNASRTSMLVAAVVGLSALTASAATTTWIGNTSVDWATAANWDTLLVPASGDSLVFGLAGTAGTSLNNNVSDLVINGIVFNESASSYTIAGNAFTLTGPLANNSTSVQLLNNAITLAAVQSFTGSGHTILAGALSGADTSITKTGAGTITLSSPSTLSTGNLNITGGLFRLTNGIINVAATGGNSQLANSGNVEVSGGTLNITDTGGAWFPIGATGGQTSTFVLSSGEVTVSNRFGTQVGQAGNGVLTITGGVFTATDTFGNGIKIAEGGGTTGVINLDGGTLRTNLIGTNAGAARFNFNGGVFSPIASSPTWFNANANVVAEVRNGGAIIDTAGFNATIGQGLVHSTVVGDNAVDGGLTKRGAGILTLSGVNTYTGPTTVTAGKLALAGSGEINASSAININGGGFVTDSTTAVSPTVNVINGSIEGSGTINTVVVSNNAANWLGNTAGAVTPLTIGSLTFSGAAALNLNVGDTNADIVTTTLTTNAAGSIVINANNVSWAPGQYSLVSYATLGGAGFSRFTKGTISGLSGRQMATLVNTGSAIALNVTGDNPVWTGALDNRWTTATLANPKNWKLITQGTGTDYINGDAVLFDDSAAGNTTISISDANVTPTSVAFNNLGVPYTINGPFGIAGTASVTLNGSQVTLAAPSTYSGGTNLNMGTLNINHASAIGTGTLTIANATALDNTSGGPITLTTNNAQVWNGDFAFNGTNDLNLGTGNVTLSGNRMLVIQGPGILTVGGNITGTGNLSQLGSGTLRLSGTNTFTGSLIVNSGAVEIAGGSTGLTTQNVQISAEGTGTGTVIVSGGQLLAARVIIGGNSANGGVPNSGTLTQTGGTITSQQWFTVGSGGGGNFLTGTYNLSAGTLNVITSQFEVANFANAEGIVNMSGGAVNIMNNINLAMGANNNAANGTFNQTGGTVTFFSDNGTTSGGNGAIRLGSAGTLPATSTYTYNLDGGTLTVSTITANTGGGNQSTSILNLNGGLLRAGRTNANWISGLDQVNIGAGGAMIDTQAFAVTTGQALSGPGALTKIGTGTLTLNGTSSYTGATNITGGSLVVGGTGSINTTASIIVTGGGRFATTSSTPVTVPVTVTSGGVDGSGSIGTVTVAPGAANFVGNGTGGPLTINNLTLSGAATLNLNVNSTAAGLIAGSLIASGGAGSVTVNAASPTWTSGQTYQLVNYTTLGGTGASAFALGTLGGLTPRQQANLVTSAGVIGVQIAGGNIPVWTGAVNGNWTTAVIPDPKNWKLQTGGAATDFLTGDIVLFDDTATGTTTLVISDASVAPTGVTFDNSAKNYAVTSPGGFGISSGFLIKNGTGTLTLDTTNTYGGGTTLNQGALVLNQASSVGSGTLTMNAGTLILNNSASTNGVPIVINGGTLDSNGAADVALSPSGRVFLNSDITFIGTRNLSLGTGSITLGGAGTERIINVAAGRLAIGSIPVATGFGLTKTGPGTLAINATATSNLSGPLNVAEGTFQIGNADFVTPALTGSGALQNGSGTSRTLFVNGAATNTTFSGTLSGGGSGNLNLNKQGAGSLTLAGSGNNTLGTVTIPAGQLAFSGTGTTSTGNMIVSGGKLLVSAGVVNVAATGGTTRIIDNGSIMVTGGSLNIAGAGSWFPIGDTAGSAGTFLVTGGAVDIANNFGTEVGRVGSGTLTITGGSYTNRDTSNVGIILGDTATALNNTINLDGGTLRMNRIQANNGVNTINFNGGTLTSIGTNNNNFLNAFASLTANVRNGGLIVDSAGFTPRISEDLVHSTIAGDNAIDGGLTKNGAGTLTLRGNNTYTGPTTVNQGLLVFSTAANSTNTIGAIRGTAVTIDANTVVISSPNAGPSKVDTLTIAGATGAWTGKLDLTNNAIVVGAADAAAQATVMATLQDQLTSGNAAGTWTGNGITSSTMTDSSFAAVNTVVLADAGELGITSFRGLPGVDANSTILAVARNGDATLDGIVDAFDLNRLASNWQGSGSWTGGDFNGDTLVDAFDLNILASSWQFGVGGSLQAALASFPQFSGAVAQVPEPTSLAVLALGASACLLRGRRRKSR